MKKPLFKLIVGIVLFTLLGTGYFLLPNPIIQAPDDGKSVRTASYNSSFTVAFSQPMQKESVEQAFSIFPSIKGNLNWLDRRHLEFVPQKALQIGDEYEIGLEASARNLYGKSLVEDVTLYYKVTGAPFIQFVYPEEGSVIEPHQAVTVLFDRPMKLENLDSLLSIDPPVKGEYRKISSSAFQFIPEAWPMSSHFILSIPREIQAMDGGQTEKGLTWKLSTPGPQVVFSTPVSDSTDVSTQADLTLKFNQEVSLDDLRPGENVQLFPSNDLDANDSLKEDGFFNAEIRYAEDEAGDVDKTVLIFSPTFPYQSNQEYHFRVDLGEPFELNFHTAEREMPEEDLKNSHLKLTQAPHLFAEGTSPQISFTTHNLKEITVTVCDISEGDYLRRTSSFSWSQYQCRRPFSKTLKATSVQEIDLSTIYTGVMERGLYFFEVRSGDQVIGRPFVVSNTAFVAKKASGDVLVWALDLTTGEPVSRMEITLLDPEGQEIVRGVTDGNGIYKISKDMPHAVFVRGVKSIGGDRRYSIAYLENGRSLFSGVPLASGEHVSMDEGRVYLLTDRSHYLPGDELAYKGIYRLDRGANLLEPNVRRVTLAFQNEFGETLETFNASINRDGSFFGQFEIPKTIAFGTYRLRVITPERLSQLSPAFMVGHGTSSSEFDEMDSKTPDVPYDFFDVKLTADQPQYFLGGKARIQIEAPGATPESPIPALITYERSGILGYQVILLDGTGDQVELFIKEEMLPHFYVSVMALGQNGFSSGLIDIPVSLRDKEVLVDIHPSRAQYEAGDEVKVEVKTHDYQNRVVPSVLTVLVRSKQDVEPLNPLDYFYSKRALDVYTSSNLKQVLDLDLAPPIFEETDFKGAPAQLVAFFDPAIETDQGGTAHFNFTLPDDQHEFEILAIVTSQEDQFGMGRQMIGLKRPIVIQPILPEMANVSDRFNILAIIQNTSEETVDSTATLNAEGLKIYGGASRNLSLKPGEKMTLQWNVSIEPTAQDELELKFGVGSYGIRVPFQILPQKASYATLLESGFYPSADNIVRQILSRLSRGEMEDDSLLIELNQYLESDGGYSMFSDSASSHPMVSAYALYALERAKEAGFEVYDDALAQYLWGALAESDSFQSRALILWALSEAGQLDTRSTLALFEERESLSLFGRSLLLMNLERLVQAGQRSLEAFVDRLKSEMLSEEFLDTQSVASFMVALKRFEPENPALEALGIQLSNLSSRDKFLTPFDLLWSLMALDDLEGYLAGKTPISSHLLVSRAYYSTDEKVARQPFSKLQLGQTYKGVINIIIPQDMQDLAVEEMLPAGVVASASEDSDWPFEEHFFGNRIVLFAEKLPKGVYQYEFNVHPQISGQYRHLPTLVYQKFFPGVYARTEESLIEVVN